MSKTILKRIEDLEKTFSPKKTLTIRIVPDIEAINKMQIQADGTLPIEKQRQLGLMDQYKTFTIEI